MQRARILILWNQLEDDVYEHYRQDGRRTPDWDATLEVEPWETAEEEMQLIQRSIESAGHVVEMLNIRDSFDAMLAAIRTFQPDVVMNLIEFFRDDAENEHMIPALFELLGVEYTGNRPFALSMCQNKPLAKALLAAQGLPVPRGVVVDAVDQARDLGLRFPLIVKPAYDDASGGIDTGSVVHTQAQLITRVTKGVAEHKHVIVEEYIDGRELHCAILGDEALPLYEMKFIDAVDDAGEPLPKIITFNAKWDPYSRDHHAMTGVCPVEDLDPATAARVKEVAIRAYRALKCRDYVRVDMRLDAATNEPYILEVNPNPDLADACAYTASAQASGRDYAAMINDLINLAIARARAPKLPVAPGDQLLSEYLEQRKQSGKA